MLGQVMARMTRLSLGLAAMAGGLMLMGAEPAPAPAPVTAAPAAATPEARKAAVETALTKAFPTPRLYRVENTGTYKSAADGSELCMGVSPVFKLIGDLASHPDAVAALTKGCTQSTSRAGESVHLEQTCDAAAGSFFTGRMTLDGKVVDGVLREMRQRMDISLPGGTAGAPTPVWTETHMTLAGECPAGMKAGQVRDSQGRISDPLAALTESGSEAKAKKSAASK